MEKRLQGLQLVLGEYGAMPARPALDLVESLQLARVPLGALTDPDCRVEETHGPGEPGVCKGRGTATVLEVGGWNTHLAQGSSGTSCTHACCGKEAAGQLAWVTSCIISMPVREGLRAPLGEKRAGGEHWLGFPCLLTNCTMASSRKWRKTHRPARSYVSVLTQGISELSGCSELHF